jgi:pimeloyl-ACP methyl ester carboxylesterase
MAWPTQQGVFPLGDLKLQSGATLPDARLSWKAHGTLTAARDNVILYPTSYGAQHSDLEWLIGPEGVLDPTRYFVLIIDMFGNGLSSSPSDTAEYPSPVTVFDNVHAQRRLLREVFGIEQLACVYGWSMGALQAYHWAALFPDAVSRAVVNCGVARTAVHNQVFLRGLMGVLEAAPEHLGAGRFAAEPVAAKRAFGRIYAGAGAQSGRAGPGDVLAHGLGGPVWGSAGGEPIRPASHLGCGGYQCKRGVWRGPAGSAARHQGEGVADAGGDRSLFPRCGQRGGVAASGAGRTAADPEHLGSSRRQSGGEPGGCAVREKRGAGLVGRVGLSRERVVANNASAPISNSCPSGGVPWRISASIVVARSTPSLICSFRPLARSSTATPGCSGLMRPSLRKSWPLLVTTTRCSAIARARTSASEAPRKLTSLTCAASKPR